MIKLIFVSLLSAIYLYTVWTGDSGRAIKGKRWGVRKGPRKLTEKIEYDGSYEGFMKTKLYDETLKYQDCKYLELIDGKLYCNLFNDWLPDFNYCGADATYDCEMQKDLNDYMSSQDSQNNQGL